MFELSARAQDFVNRTQRFIQEEIGKLPHQIGFSNLPRAPQD